MSPSELSTDASTQPETRGARWFSRVVLRPTRDWFIGRGLWPAEASSKADSSWFVLDPNCNDENVRLLYQKTFEVLSIFLDWRHKTMMLGFTVLAAAIALDEWLFVHQTPHWALAIPLFAAAGFCLVVRRFDLRNQSIINGAYGAGRKLEEKLGARNGAMLRQIPTTQPGPITRRSESYSDGLV